MINRLRPIAPGVLCLLYRVFVLPIFDYCDKLWSPSNASSIRRLERVHSNFLSSLPSPHNSDLGITLAKCRTFYTAVQVSKYCVRFHLHIKGLFSYATIFIC